MQNQKTIAINRLKIYPASEEQMKAFIAAQKVLKKSGFISIIGTLF